jgi:hypothetical protein
MAARATGQANPAQVAPGRGRPTGHVPRRSTGAGTSKARTDARSSWQQRATIAGRIGVWAIPVLAVLAARGLRSTNAFASDPAVYANFLATKWSSPMAIALTTGTVVFALISVIGLTLVLLAGRAKWLAIAGAVPGVVGSIMMLDGAGSVVVQAQGAGKTIWQGRWHDFVATAQSAGTGAAWLVFGGAVLLTIGWILLGLAVMRTRGLNRGDGALLAISAPLVYLGGFALHILPALGAFLLGAAGLGIIFTSGRVAREAGPMVLAARAARLPATMPSAFARFMDDEPSTPAGAHVADAGAADGQTASGAAPARTNAGASSHGTHVTSAHPAHVPTASSAEPVRKRGLGGLTRGISTAWQVNRAARSASNGSNPAGSSAPAKSGSDGTGTTSSATANNGSATGRSAESSSTGSAGAPGSRDPMNGLINPPVKARWNGVLNRKKNDPNDPLSAAAAGAAGAGNRQADKNADVRTQSKPVNGAPVEHRGMSKKRGGKSGAVENRSAPNNSSSSENGRGSAPARE